MQRLEDDKTFYPFYEKRISRITGKLQSRCKENVFLTDDIWDGIAVDLYEVFHQAAVRCLIVELHVCKNEGRLSGETGKEEYNNYCRLLGDKLYTDSIYKKYPGLLKYLDKLENIQISFWKETLGRLIHDWRQIIEYFHLKAGSQILSIRRSGSDFHYYGKSVVIIETDQKKKILYKPHTLENEIYLQNLLTEIYVSLGLQTFRYLELERNGYGWVEEVIWKECRNKDEVISFYKRAGILAAVAYVMGIGDLHYENIIAHGEYPVIIDAETLFQHMNPLYQWTEKTMDFYSVLSSGLFPGGSADQNTAGITGGIHCISTNKKPVILHDKTTEICVSYQKTQMPEGKNHLRYQGKNVCWENYEKEIGNGFQMAYTWFYNHKEEVLKRVTGLKDKLKSRYVSDGTQHFGLSLFASVHPELMYSEYDRKKYLKRLYKDRKLGQQEVEAIFRGDIPCFFRKMTDRNLYDEFRIIYCNFFQNTIEELIYDRLRMLSREDCELQKKIINVSARRLGHNPGKERIEETISGENDDDGTLDGVECAKRIAAYILENAIWQRGKIYWLGIEEEKEKLKVKPVDIYFYSGIAGIAIFFRQLHQVCGLYGNICERLEEELFCYTDRVYRNEISPITEYTGMYCGEGAVVYAYQLLYRITGTKNYLEYASKHAEILIRCVKKNSLFDLLYGNAGAVYVLCQQYVNTNKLIYLTEAKRILDYLDNNRIETEQGITWFKQAEGNPVCSMAHGNSGILLAYARVNSFIHDDILLRRMHQIMAYEDQYYKDEYANWADLRKKSYQWGTYAWCNGGIGVVYARYLAKKWNPEELKEVEIHNKIKRLAEKLVISREMCLCHGSMGNLFILHEVSKELNDDVMEILHSIDNRVKKKMIYFIKMLKERDIFRDIGFMNGITGIGCLTLSENDFHNNLFK